MKNNKKIQTITRSVAFTLKNLELVKLYSKRVGSDYSFIVNKALESFFGKPDKELQNFAKTLSSDLKDEIHRGDDA
jgi:hypothetical protein